jgi:hypothetical protein
LGILAGIGHVTGVNDIIEGVTGTDLLTGEHLSTIDADTRFFSGVSALAFTIAGGMSIMGVDVCLANGCFVAGTQVVLAEVEEEESANGESSPQVNLTADGATLTATRRYLTQNIELLRKDDLVLSRSETDASGKNVLRRIEEVFVRRVYSLQILTIRSSCGTLQTIRTTQVHPVYINSRGWVDAAHVEAGDQIMEPGGSLAIVIASRYENYPEGILVYNFSVSGTHTYFVRQQGSTAEPLWVHNVYAVKVGPQFEEELVRVDGLSVKTPKEVLGEVHGNSLEATGPHSVYGIIDESTGELLHIGETGNLAKRIADHVRDFTKMGIKNIRAYVLDITEGKAAAKLSETDLIKLF